MPKEEVAHVYEENSPVVHSSGIFEAKLLNDGDILSWGGFNLECIHTPGHSPGHMCLYDRTTETMFLGDHVLFDITPNICAWSGIADSLGDYLNSLKKIAEYKVSTALPSHRGQGSVNLQTRVEQLLEHHRYRLEDTLNVITKTPGLSGYEIAQQMNWNIIAHKWDDFPCSQKYFAESETLSHIDNLVVRGLVRRVRPDDGLPKYYSL